MTEVTPAELGALAAVRLEVVANGQNVDAWRDAVRGRLYRAKNPGVVSQRCYIRLESGYESQSRLIAPRSVSFSLINSNP